MAPGLTSHGKPSPALSPALSRFYNGNARMEPGAVVCRVARCFIRFGTFQLPASREGQAHLVSKLTEYVIRHHYPHLQGKAGGTRAARRGAGGSEGCRWQGEVGNIPWGEGRCFPASQICSRMAVADAVRMWQSLPESWHVAFQLQESGSGV